MREQKESSVLQERTELLHRIGVQLTMMSEGRDTRLDRILQALRELLRDGSELPQLHQTADTLFRYMMLDGGAEVLSKPAGQRLVTAVDELLDVMALPAKTRSELNELCDQFSQSDDLASALLLLKRVTTTLRKVGSLQPMDQGVAPRRFFGKKEGDDNAVQQLESFVAAFKQLLLGILEHMVVLNETQERVHELRQELQQADTIEALENVLREVMAMLKALTREVKIERRQTEAYLSQLRDKLHVVGEDIGESLNFERSALERAEKFSSEMGAEIGVMESKMHQDDDIHNLRASLGGHIKIINNQLIDHLQRERELHEETKYKVKALTRRIRAMENETDELRFQVHKKQQLAMTDALTGVYNRAAYEDRIEQEISRFHRNSAPLAIVVIDCDKFKHINDNFGHKAGDMVLKKVAEVMKSRARSSDFLARYGGDEFVVLLPDTGEDGAKIFVESVRQRVANAGFHNRGKPLEITISSGLTVVKEADTAETAFERADKAMYLAKRGGRNNIGVLL